MLRSLLRSSALLSGLHAWFHGTRLHVRGRGHRIDRHQARLHTTEIEINGTNCRLVIGPGAHLWGCSIKLMGNGAELHIGAGCQLRDARLVAEDDGSRLLVGASTSMTGPTLVCQEGGLLQLGSDCMVAQHAELRNTDSHSILDGATGARLNPASDVILGDHVWIGLGAFVFKGSRIPSGTVVAARALVAGELPPACIAVGTPAKAVRHGIVWQRARLPATPAP
ncbi:MAG: hypothetical protein IPL39_03695 [Opitutaceae bacterium]|nr:hypothetical protein [Opitutaceae bacterium]